MSLVKDVLQRKKSFVAVIAPDASVAEAARIMSDRRIGSLVVLDGLRVVGILTERDLLTRIVAQKRDPSETRVDEVMTNEVIVCRPETTLQECKGLISRGRVRHLPVVDRDNQLIGLVTSGDILHQELAEQGDAIETLHAYVHMVPSPPPRGLSLRAGISADLGVCVLDVAVGYACARQTPTSAKLPALCASRRGRARGARTGAERGEKRI